MGRGEFAGGVGRVAVLRFVLDPDGVSSDALVPESLQRLQEVRRICRTIRLEVKAPEVMRGSHVSVKLSMNSPPSMLLEVFIHEG